MPTIKVAVEISPPEGLDELNTSMINAVGERAALNSISNDVIKRLVADGADTVVCTEICFLGEEETDTLPEEPAVKEDEFGDDVEDKWDIPVGTCDDYCEIELDAPVVNIVATQQSVLGFLSLLRFDLEAKHRGQLEDVIEALDNV